MHPHGPAGGLPGRASGCQACACHAGQHVARACRRQKRISRGINGWDLSWRDRYPLRWQALLLRELAQHAGVPADSLESRFKLVLEGRSAILLASA